jgi:hypothetical protein
VTSAAAKVSACVDCGTPIIGAALRCPVCRDQHVKRLDTAATPAVAAPAGDQEAKPAAYWQGVFAAFVLVQVIVVVVVLLMLVGKGCS